VTLESKHEQSGVGAGDSGPVVGEGDDLVGLVGLVMSALA